MSQLEFIEPCKDWDEFLLSDVARTTSGGTPDRSNKDFYEGTIPWVKSGELNDNFLDYTEEHISDAGLKNSSAKLFPAGTLLMAMYGATVGKTAILKIDAATNQAVCGIFANEAKADTEFLRYQLVFFRKKLLSERYGGAQPNISQTIIKNIRLRLPPLHKQRRIAHVLSTMQTAIEQQARLIALTRELKTVLMRKLFTEGLRGEKQEETEIGLVPESWTTCQIGKIAKLQSGGTPSRDNPKFWTGGTIPWVKTTEINYRIIETTQEFITKEGLNNSAAKILPKGTLLAAMYGQGVTRGRVGILGLDAATNQACAAITPIDEKQILTWYLFYYLQFHYEDLRELGHGANQRNLNMDLIKSFALSYPEIEEQQEIINSLSAFDKKLSLAEQKRDLLEDLFRTLLHQLMTGQVRVKGLEI